MTQLETDIQAVWQEYRERPTVELRNRLVERYLPLVKYNAERIWARLPGWRRTRRPHQCRRLRTDGRDRRLRPDPRREVRDLLRAAYPRGHARRTAHDGLGAAAGAQQGQQDGSGPQGTRSRPRPPAAAARNSPRSSAFRSNRSTSYLGEATAVNLVSLNKKWYETDSYKDVREIDILEDKKAEDPTGRLQNRDLMRLVTRGLNRNERLIVILYYYEEMTMKEIGATLNLSESRVSQMHSSIVARLQAHLPKRKGEFNN